MLRVAMRLEADLDRTVEEINEQLADDLAANRFVTAFVGTLSSRDHRVDYHAAAQAPLMHFHAASGDLVNTGPTGTNVMDLMLGLKLDRAAP